MPSDIPEPIDPVAVKTAEQQMLTPRNELRMRELLDALCDPRGRDPASPCGAAAASGLRAADPHRHAHGPRAPSWARYAGLGVHEAARIGRAADAGEVLVSGATLEASKTMYPSVKRSLTLKDIPEPVEVASIAWR